MGLLFIRDEETGKDKVVVFCNNARCSTGRIVDYNRKTWEDVSRKVFARWEAFEMEHEDSGQIEEGHICPECLHTGTGNSAIHERSVNTVN